MFPIVCILYTMVFMYDQQQHIFHLILGALGVRRICFMMLSLKEYWDYLLVHFKQNSVLGT